MVSAPVASTALLELVALAFFGLVALMAWPLGWRLDPTLVALTTSLVAIGPSADLYHAGGPPRRLAVATALTALATVTLLVAATANWAVPALAGTGVGFAVGCLVGVPVGVGVLAWSLGRAKAA